ncbi:MAG: 2-dehydro-3-deoxy-6-phosphogalactonate aldolase [Arenimonas sp.]|nr:2-dehydro-3-deoxy-6-phosphogalactonate aldolase [Arenimonas sp.]
MTIELMQHFHRMPIVAILRGVRPEDVLRIADILVSTGIRVIEVPLNSPNAMESIRCLVAHYGDTILCGAGTVLHVEAVERVHATGAKLIVSPNTNRAVIERSIALGMMALPGFATATEAFSALEAGATGLKLFPANSYGIGHLKALRAVLPAKTLLIAVGGAGADNAAEWATAGADGLGVGTELFHPSYSDAMISERAKKIVESVSNAFQINKTV